jgi:dTDP-4-amino-4,6-dideoxygalactose transaminase
MKLLSDSDRHLTALGGEPSIKDNLPITRPTTVAFDDLAEIFKGIVSSGQLTNGEYVRRFEDAAKEYLGVKHAVAVASCTAGLMLTLKALDISGSVILPGFTFFATAHAVLWNGLNPAFADCDPSTFNIDVNSVARSIAGDTAAILAVYIFGNPPDIGDLENLANKYGLKLIFDAAHAFGSLYRGRKAGSFGDAEVFSLSPTKLLVACEGGLVTTNDDVLARRIRIGRDYGNPGDYDPEFVGLNARMTEFNAAFALKNLETIEFKVKKRNELASLYQRHLAGVPGIRFQTIDPRDRSTFKDFSVLIDPKLFGSSRDELSLELLKSNIATKKYYYPAVHKLKSITAACAASHPDLPATDHVSKNIISLPIYSHMTSEEVERVVKAVKDVQAYLKT